MSVCPYCGYEAGNITDEVAHMEAKHSDVIHERLRVSGLEDRGFHGGYKTALGPAEFDAMMERFGERGRADMPGGIVGELERLLPGVTDEQRNALFRWMLELTDTLQIHEPHEERDHEILRLSVALVVGIEIGQLSERA